MQAFGWFDSPLVTSGGGFLDLAWERVLDGIAKPLQGAGEGPQGGWLTAEGQLLGKQTGKGRLLSLRERMPAIVLRIMSSWQSFFSLCELQQEGLSAVLAGEEIPG